MSHKKELLRGLWVEIKVGLSHRRRGLVVVVVVAVAVVSSSTCRSVVLVILLVFVIVLALVPALALALAVAVAAVSVAAAFVRHSLGPLVLFFSIITMNSSCIYCTLPCPCCLVTRAGVERCTLTVQAFGPLALGPSASDLKGVLFSSSIPRSSFQKIVP